MFDSGSDVTVKALATALCIGGVVVLGYVGFRYLDGSLRADAVRRQWEELQARATVARARSNVATMASVGPVALGAPVARLRIPRIRLDEIVLEGVDDDELNAGPGHLPGSALPGMTGNAVISAHRDRHFSRLDELQLGDTIRTETDQSSTAWIVVARRVVGRESPALFKANEPLLTLTTCWPVRYFGEAPDRLILSAKPVGDARPSRSARTS
jgi:sortase A